MQGRRRGGLETDNGEAHGRHGASHSFKYYYGVLLQELLHDALEPRPDLHHRHRLRLRHAPVQEQGRPQDSHCEWDSVGHLVG